MILYYNEPKTILFKESQLFDLLCGKEKKRKENTLDRISDENVV